LATVNRARRCAGDSISSTIATAKSSALTLGPAGLSSATTYAPVLSPGAMLAGGLM
jgi:hypothetical protein